MSATAAPGPVKTYDGALRWASEAILGAFYAVYRELGTGFLESVYEAAMAVALGDMGIHVERQVPVSVCFRGSMIGSFRVDLLVESAVAVELKACRSLESAHEAQLLNYLRASELEVGLVLNFGEQPSFKRLVYSNERKSRTPRADAPGAGHG
jgi:GxxExxY protein